MNVGGKLNTTRRGFTLLEVILALAILGIALATLGQAVGRSHESAGRAARETELAIVAQSVLDELLSEARALTATEREPVADVADSSAPPLAMISVVIENGPVDGVLVVTVRAEPSDTAESATVDQVRLVRWMLDPSSVESAQSEAGL